jgi:integrase
MADSLPALAPDPAGRLVPGPSLAERAGGYARQARADNTRRAYRAAWADFCGWCASQGRQPLPASPATIGLFLADRAATHRVASLRLRLVALRHAHNLAGHRLDLQDPAIAEVWRGICRSHASAPAKKDAATTELLRGALRVLERQPGLRPLRDRALLLVGFTAALRRSELVALEVADLTFRAEGLVLRLRRRKTDQDGQGSDIGLPAGHHDLTCPVRALQAWLAAAGITEGPVFRAVNKAARPATTRLSDRAVALVVKAALAAAGHDSRSFSGHSLRSGFATSAARAGVPEAQIQSQTGHKSLPVLRGYIRRGSLFRDNAAGKLGL